MTPSTRTPATPETAGLQAAATQQTATPESAASPGAAATAPTSAPSRVQLALDVDDLEAAIAFYGRLFGAEPAKRRPGYANFALDEPALKLVLIENPGHGGGLNHLGVEVPSTGDVSAATRRLADAGLVTDAEEGVTCCYATQDKVWVTDPDGARWEVYTVLADAEVAGDVTGACCA